MRILFFILFFASTCGYAQQPVYEIINNHNGLPSKTVYKILSDRNGFLWIGHEKGISRYDGKNFKNYFQNTSRGKSSTSLQQSADGRIWFVNFDGDVFYTSAKSDSVIEEPKLKTDKNWGVIIYKDNYILKPTTNKILQLNLKNNELTSVKTPFNTSEFKNVNLQDDELLLTSFHLQGSISSYSIFQNNKFTRIIENIKTVYPQSLPSKGLIKANNCYWLIISGNGISFLNLNTGVSISEVQSKSELVINYYHWENNILWVCTTNGLYAFDKLLNPLFDGKPLFSDFSISDILFDRENILWISTLNGGMIKVPSLNIVNYNFNNSTITALTSDRVNGNIYFGNAHNEIYKWDSKTENQKQLFDGKNNKDVSALIFNPLTHELLFSSDKSYSLNVDSKTINPIYQYCKDFEIIDKTHFAVATPFGFGFYQALENSKFKVDANSLALNKYYAMQKQAVRTRCVAYDKNEEIFYAGTINGLIQVKDSTTEEIKNKNASIIAADLILLNDCLFAGTLNDGLFQIQNKKIVTLFNSKNGLLSNSIIKLKLFDNKLWILSDKGLQQLNIAGNKFINYLFNNSLTTNEISDFEILDNKFFLASTSGIIEMPIQSKASANKKPLIWIDKFYCDKTNYNFDKKLSFEAGSHLVEIFLTLPNFRNTNQIEIYYQVNQSEWQRLGNGEQGLTLAQLSSGNYKVKFKAECNGLESALMPEVNFTIKTPWYFSWWFLLSCGIVFITFVYFIIKNEFRKQRIKQQFETEKNKLEKELQQSTLASIKSQMNPHFLFNALNTIQSYIYQNDKQNASQYLGKFSELTRMILEMSNREKVSLTEEIKALKLYLELEQLRFEEKLKYDISIAKNVDAEMIHIPSMLIQPYIENAIKHGLLHKKDNWLLNISFERNDNTLIVKVDDNGIGRKRSQELQRLKLKQHQSFAMSANEKRLDILNKGLAKPIALQIVDKSNNNGEAIGTTVILNIPLLSGNITTI